MPNKISFQVAAVSDADALADLRVEAMRESLLRVGRFDPQRARDRFLSKFNPADTYHIVLNGERVGFYMVTAHDDGLFIDHLYIKPGCQGRGLGAAALGQIFDRADHLGASVRVGALRESDANRFYQRHGFVLAEKTEWDHYYVRQVKAPRPANPTGNPFQISRISNSVDYFEMLDVFEKAFKDSENYGAQGRPGKVYVESLLSNPDFIGLLARDEKGQAAGALAGYVLRKFERERSEIYIYDLAVGENFRRQGLASALIGDLKGMGQKMGAYVIFVQADKGPEDQAAQALYRKLGAEEDVFHYDIEVPKK